MDEVVAVEMASEAAEQEGYDVRQYNVRINRTSDGWAIHYLRKNEAKPSPGDFFAIYVDEESESVRRIVHGK